MSTSVESAVSASASAPPNRWIEVDGWWYENVSDAELSMNYIISYGIDVFSPEGPYLQRTELCIDLSQGTPNTRAGRCKLEDGMYIPGSIKPVIKVEGENGEPEYKVALVDIAGPNPDLAGNIHIFGLKKAVKYTEGEAPKDLMARRPRRESEHAGEEDEDEDDESEHEEKNSEAADDKSKAAEDEPELVNTKIANESKTTESDDDSSVTDDESVTSDGDSPDGDSDDDDYLKTPIACAYHSEWILPIKPSWKGLPDPTTWVESVGWLYPSQEAADLVMQWISRYDIDVFTPNGPYVVRTEQCINPSNEGNPAVRCGRRKLRAGESIPTFSEDVVEVEGENGKSLIRARVRQAQGMTTFLFGDQYATVRGCGALRNLLPVRDDTVGEKNESEKNKAETNKTNEDDGIPIVPCSDHSSAIEYELDWIDKQNPCIVM